jgi:mRNA interferase MazF
MRKDFKKWNNVKEMVNDLDSSRIYFQERDIWWCYLGLNVGTEEDGKGDYFMRPVLIIKKCSRNLCWAIPLSTVVTMSAFYFPLLSELNKIRMAIIPQMVRIDVRRLRSKMDRISIMEFGFIKEKLATFLR